LELFSPQSPKQDVVVDSELATPWLDDYAFDIPDPVAST
jgi:hypothetical protein